MKRKTKTSQYDDYMTNMILGVFSFAFLLIVGLMATYRGYGRIDSIAITMRLVYGFSAFAALMAIVGAVWEHRTRKKGIDNKYKVFRGRNLSAASAFAAICALIAARFFVDGIKVLYIIIPAAAVLVLIYLIYSSEFFFISAITATTGFLMWYFSKAYYVRPITRIDPASLLSDLTFYAGIVALIALLIAALVVFSASRNGGAVKVGKRSFKLFRPSTKYGLIYLSIAVSFLCTVAALVFGSIVAYYLLFVVFGYLFVLAVYYTVKLM
ncbi:MAG: hypothetical protein ACOX1Q_01895 [Eubacteriales bacterium]